MRNWLILVFGCTFLLQACQSQQTDITTRVDQFFQTYNQREDFDYFLSFYVDDILFEDIISGDRIEGKENLRAFLDWENPGFQKAEDKLMVLTSQVVEGNKADSIRLFYPLPIQ